MKSKELVQLCTEWSEKRNIINGTSIPDQLLKLMEEVGELSKSINENTSPIDDIGDCLVLLNNTSIQLGCGNIKLSKSKKLNKGVIDIQKAKKIYLEFVGSVGLLCTVMDNDWFDSKDCINTPIYKSTINCCIADLRILAEYYGLTLKECLEHAYNDIKDRIGVIINGAYVKQDNWLKHMTQEEADKLLKEMTNG